MASQPHTIFSVVILMLFILCLSTCFPPGGICSFFSYSALACSLEGVWITCLAGHSNLNEFIMTILTILIYPCKGHVAEVGNERILPGSVKTKQAKRSSFLPALKTQDVSPGDTGGPSSWGVINLKERLCHTEKSRDNRWNEINRKS